MSHDMGWVRKVHPGALSLEDWMRKTGYNGSRALHIKSHEDGGKWLRPILERMKAL